MISRNPNFKEYIDTLADNQVILETICPFCGKKQRLVFNGKRAEDYKKARVAYEAGYRIQDAFDKFSVDEREFIISGICPKCWDNM